MSEKKRLFDAQSSPAHASGDAETTIPRLQKGMWIWNTAQLIIDGTRIDQLVGSAKAIHITDVYLYVAPGWYGDKGSDIASFNRKLTACGIRVWALDGDVSYIDNVTAEEGFVEGLQGLAAFNDRVEPNARFHGFQADIEPQDTAEHTGCFHNGVPESQLTQDQYTQRDILMHKWLNVLTRASALCHSYDMPFGAAMPFWLHDYEGEGVTVPWVSISADRSSARTCVMDLIMPLVDEYVVMTYSTDPAAAVARILYQARYASAKALEGHKMPYVLGSVETAKGVRRNTLSGDVPGRTSKGAVLDGIATIEKTLRKYPAFAGMAIYHWASWADLPS